MNAMMANPSRLPIVRIVVSENCACGDSESDCPEEWYVVCPRCENAVEVDGAGEAKCDNGHRIMAV